MKNPMIYLLGNEHWYNEKGEYHRENGPALKNYIGVEYWYINGLRHRANGPAIQDPTGYKAWYKNGRVHRTDGPAVEYYDGHKEYWLNGKRYDSLEEGLMDQAIG